MFALRFVSALALTVWLGGAVTIGLVVAPAAFATLPSPEAATMVGETLRRFHLVTYAAGAVIVLLLVAMALLGPRPLAFSRRLWVAGLMLAASLVSGLWVDGRIATTRTEIGVPVRSLPDGDARRVTFGRLHGLSTLLMAATVLGGVALVYWNTRDAR
jgi:hypothetical protein